MRLPIEQEFLRHCILRELGGSIEADLDAESDGHWEDDGFWNRFLLLADRNDVLPLAYSACSRFPQKVPSHVLARMGERCVSIAAWNLTLTSELVALTRVLKHKGIQSIAYKGPALAMALYGRIGSRQCRDLDILVDRGSVWSVVEVLQCRGYSLVAAPDAPTCRDAILERYKDVTLENPSSGICVEVHWSICEPAFDAELHSATPWEESRPIALLDQVLSIPAPEDLLFLLCVHGARHYWNSLKWVCDIAQLLRTSSELNWPLLLQKIDRFGQRRTVWIGLRLAEDLLHAPVPEHIRSSIKEDLGCFWSSERHLFPNLLSENNELFPESGKSLLESRVAAEMDIAKKLARLRSKDRVADRLRFAFQLVCDFVRPEAKDHRIQAMGKKGLFVSWILQPIRLMRAYGLLFFIRASKRFFLGVVR